MKMNMTMTAWAILFPIITVLVIWTFVWKPLTDKISEGFNFVEKTSAVQEVGN